MPEDDRGAGRTHRVTLYVCSGCEACHQAATFLLGWADGRAGVTLDIVSVLRQPEQIVRLGITHTPALVVDGARLAQNASVDTLADRLLIHLNGPAVASALAG